MKTAINLLQDSLDKIDYLHDTLKTINLDAGNEEFVKLSTEDAEKLLEFPYLLSVIGYQVCIVRDCHARLEENTKLNHPYLDSEL